MSKDIKILNQKFNSLTVVEKLNERSANGSVLWLCRCDCGNLCKAYHSQLKLGRKKSCGCTNYPDLVGKRFGKLVVEEKTDERRNSFVVWKCKCDCGNFTYVTTAVLNNGDTQSCGCLRVEKQNEYLAKYVEETAIDFTGKRFGRLLVIEPLVEGEKGYKARWKCKCDCGEIVNISGRSLASGRSNSCGCLLRESSSKIGKVAIQKALQSLQRIDGTVIESLNAKLSSRNKTGVKGVSMDRGRYLAQICFKNKRYYLGRYNNLDDAAEARKIAEDKLHGEFLDWYYQTYPDKKKKQ